MIEHDDDKLVKLASGGKSALFIVGALSAFQLLGEIAKLPRAESIAPFLPGLFHYGLLAVGFALLSKAAGQDPKRPVRRFLALDG